MEVMKWLFGLAGASHLLFLSPVSAAEVNAEINHSPPYIEGDTYSNPEVIVTLTGPIVEGDSARVGNEFSPYLTSRATGQRGKLILVLNSKEGGDYAEAQKIIQLIREYNIATYVRRNDECVSACAFIFLAGLDDFWEGDEQLADRRYVLEAGGRICLHAPHREHGPGTMRDGVDAVSQMIDVMNSFLGPTLMTEILAKGPQQCLKIETVGDAARFHVFITKYRLPPLSVEALVVGSMNARWFEDGSFYDIAMPLKASYECDDTVEIAGAVDPNNEKVGYCTINRDSQIFKDVVPETVAGNAKAFTLYKLNDDISYTYFYFPRTDTSAERTALLFHSAERKTFALAPPRVQRAMVDDWAFEQRRLRRDWFFYPPSTTLESIAAK
ncbi:hypothetical protein [Rhizobium laguerreae]|uniref:hypothetical protein n=1 Tax=Rhizobium laguerreae TaxID=1076926 RepID=UPI001C908896|nr:hypothetical protein [Rhizobium laguerreae]MBY3136547.1 hypothetical protein [Rhizobium laguerreae]